MPVEEDDDKSKMSGSELLLSHAKSAWLRLREFEKVEVMRGGSELHRLILSIVPVVVFGDAESAFDRYAAFHSNSSEQSCQIG